MKSASRHAFETGSWEGILQPLSLLPVDIVLVQHQGCPLRTGSQALCTIDRLFFVGCTSSAIRMTSSKFYILPIRKMSTRHHCQYFRYCSHLKN